MTITYFNDINVYFHMKNHYKMLRNVKSVVDTSIPQSSLRSPLAMNNLDKRTKGAANEHLRKIYNTNNHQSHMHKRRGQVKKHNCLNSEAKSEASLRLENHPSRPSTRRNFNATPKEPLSVRSYSLSKSEQMFKFKQKKKPSLTSSRSNYSDPQSGSLQLDLSEVVDGSEHGTPPSTSTRPHSSKAGGVTSPEVSQQAQKKPMFAESSEEHEYLLFLLRITEDIISNDFYSNSDIRRIFKTHMELNKDRLNMRKMHLHVSNLCKELNIDCKEYQTPEISDEPDSPRKFQNSPNGHRYILNNEAFKSCPDCSVIRASSLYKTHSAMDDYCRRGDNLGVESSGDGSSISPSLLKLLEKLSLGRVTECTEPAASTSTMNSANLNAPNNLETDDTNNSEDPEESPKDFETFLEELNMEAIISNELAKNDRDLMASETDRTAIREELSTPKVSRENLSIPKIPIECSKSDIELSEKEINSYNASEKYDSEFEKCSSDNSVLSTVRSVKNDEATEQNVERTLEEEHISETKMETPRERTEAENKLIQNSKIPVLIRDSKIVNEKTSGICLEGDTKTVSSKASTTSRVSIEPEKVASKASLPNSARSKRSSQIEVKQSPIESLKKQLDDKQEPNENLYVATNETNSDDQKSLLKVILQGSINEDDYVMIKGPVYVYKPLLESEPKLIVFTDNDPEQNSRRDSLDSHRTFTVDHSNVLDQGIQYDTSLHSLDFDKSMENIWELTKTAYSQFMDMKLLHSDYDLTPEKDDSDNKYHHLLVDATTSVSGVNITESLLLSDDYLIKNVDARPSLDKSKVEIVNKTPGVDINDYLKFEPKMYENNYVIHRRLVSSVSMPKLKLNSGRPTSDRSYTGRNEYLKSGNVLRKCSSDLINFDAPSQDSSLRSEGEAIQNLEQPWKRYCN